MVEQFTDFAVIGEAEDGEEAVEFFRRHHPDVVLMDVNMPRMDGIAALVAIRAEFAAARVILLTAFDTDEDIYRGMQAGARGYLLKDAPLDTLLGAIRNVHAGYKEVPPAVGAKLSERVMTDTLTEREQEVLEELVRGKSNQEIAQALWISEATVKFHVNHILGKLDVQDRTQAVITALKRGLARLS
jgi:DNA-binding NarL/FixJ family response regulator